MGLITSRIGNSSVTHIGGSSIPLNPSKMRGFDRSSISTWMTFNNEYISSPVGRNDQYSLSMAMEYGGMSVDFEGVNTFLADVDLLLDMATAMVGTNTTVVAPLGATILRDIACALTGSNTLSVSTDLILQVACSMIVNQLTQGDVEGATLDAEVEPGISLREAIKVILSYAAGKTLITDLGGGEATVVFRDVNDTVDRIEAHVTGSERDAITLDTN